MVCLLCAAFSGTLSAAERYESGPKTRNGVGKYYMGREMAHFMSHRGAPWLERGTREQEERPDLLMKALELKPGMKVADIGCGSGYYSRRMAKVVGDKGLVYGVDIQKEMLAILHRNMAANSLTNYQAILNTTTDSKLPKNTIDLAIFVDVYHEFDHPYEMMLSICDSLKPGGRIALVEYRMEDPKVPIKLLHKMTEAQVKKEMSVQPVTFVKTVRNLPWQHVIIFEKKK
jgi:ubiquinone/menaquinone biosynthesis C-methylase UbiE